MIHQQRWFFLVALLSGLVIGACGSDDGSGDDVDSGVLDSAAPDSGSQDSGSQDSGSQSLSQLLDALKHRGCLTTKLVGSDSNVTDYYAEEFAPMLKNSPCQYLSEAVAEWGAPYDFAMISSKMQELRDLSGKDYIFEMFVPEVIADSNGVLGDSIPAYITEQGFDFASMCTSTPPIDYGEGTCVASLANAEYRRYAAFVMKRAIDHGIQAFRFGQIYLQDPTWRTSPFIGEVLSEVRMYATANDKPIVLGAGTNHIDVESYLRQFDFVYSIFDLRSNGINLANKHHICANLADPSTPPDAASTHPWGDCAANIWHEHFRSKANHVQVRLDNASDLMDDINIFSRLSDEQRRSFLRTNHQWLNSIGASHLMPYLVHLSGHAAQLENAHCYGLYPWFYSPARTGASVRNEWNDPASYPHGPYSCGDEMVIADIMLELLSVVPLTELGDLDL